jgi:hypothetical protein
MDKIKLRKIIRNIISKERQMLRENNIYRNKYDLITIDKPIIEDAIKALGSFNNVKKFTDEKRWKKFLDSQKYFQISLSRAYHGNKKSENSIIAFETGHELVAVWDDENQIGYVKVK